MEDGPPMFSQDFTCPDLLDFTKVHFRVRGYHPLSLYFPVHSTNSINLRADPRSLAATRGISVDFFSSGYLDVSVLPVRLLYLCIQYKIPSLRWVGFPIRTSLDHKVVYHLPKAFRRLPRPSSPLTAKASTVYA